MKCRLPGCGGRTSRYGAFCSAHQSRRRRHGHPLQDAICVHHLKPYIAKVRARIAKNSTSPLWPMLQTRFACLVDECHVQCAQTVYVRWHRIAALELLNIARHVPVQTIVETVAAMVYLQKEEGWRFKSDDAFRVQLARRARGLTDVNAGTTYDYRQRKVRRVYRDLNPRAAVALGRWVIDVMGSACLSIVRLDIEEKQHVERERIEFKTAIASLQ